MCLTACQSNQWRCLSKKGHCMSLSGHCAVMPMKVRPCCLVQGVQVTALTFTQAQDGCMHIVLHPAQESSKDTYPVYCRGVQPQPEMPVSIA